MAMMIRALPCIYILIKSQTHHFFPHNQSVFPSVMHTPHWPVRPHYIIHGYFGLTIDCHVRVIFLLDPLWPVDIMCDPIQMKVVSN